MKPLQPALARIAAIEAGARPGTRARRHAARRRRRSQQHEPAHREPVRPVGGTGSERADALRGFSAAGRPRDARPRLLPQSVAADGRYPRAVSGAHRARCSALADLPEPKARAARIFALERRIAAGALEPRRTPNRSQRATITGSTATSRSARPGSTGAPIFAAAGLAKQDELRGLAAERRRRHRRARRERAARDLEGLPALPSARARLALSAEGVRRRALRLPRARALRHAAAARALEARGRRHQRGARRGGRASSTSQRYFPPAEKARAEAMVRNLRRRLRRAHRPAGVDGARDQARRPRPSSPPSRSASATRTTGATTAALEVERGDAFGNAERAELFEFQRNLAKLGRPVDRSEWAMTPQEVNAVNLPAMNALNFPAAILQPPYFDPQRDPVHRLRRDRRGDRPRDQPQLR